MTLRPASMRTLTRSFLAVFVNSTSTRLPIVVPPSDFTRYVPPGATTTP